MDPRQASHIHYENGEYNKWTAYGQSKTASSLLAIEFDRKMKNKGVRGFAVHPGGIITPLQRHLANEEMVALGWKKEDGSSTGQSASRRHRHNYQSGQRVWHRQKTGWCCSGFGREPMFRRRAENHFDKSAHWRHLCVR